jgi:ribosomal silencing factor RsfS
MSTVVRRRRSKVNGTRPTAVIDDELGALLGRTADLLAPPPHPMLGQPVTWVHEVLGEETWSGQDEILEALNDHSKVAVRSAHSIGKSHIASRAVAYWVDVHDVDEVFVVTTAPSAPQVKAILWRYIKSAKRKGDLPGYITESEIPEWKVDGRLVGWGRKPQALTNLEEAKSAFQGIHAKYVLVVIDEAGGVPKWLYDAIQTLVTSPTNRVLAIGNPDDPASHFEVINRPDSGWHVIQISAYDTPAFTGEEVSDDLAEVLVGRGLSGPRLGLV